MDKTELIKRLNDDLAGELSAITAALEAERKAIADYTQRAKDAEEFGDKGLVVQLEDMVRDESTHAEETERILRDWPL